MRGRAEVLTIFGKDATFVTELGSFHTCPVIKRTPLLTVSARANNGGRVRDEWVASHRRHSFAFPFTSP